MAKHTYPLPWSSAEAPRPTATVAFVDIRSEHIGWYQAFLPHSIELAQCMHEQPSLGGACGCHPVYAASPTCATTPSQHAPCFGGLHLALVHACNTPAHSTHTQRTLNDGSTIHTATHTRPPLPDHWLPSTHLRRTATTRPVMYAPENR